MSRKIVTAFLFPFSLCLTAIAQEEGLRPERPNVKPTLFANLTDANYTPDGMTVHTQTGVLYLNVPNFGLMDEKLVKTNSPQGGYLYEIGKDGSQKKILEYPVLERTGQTGPMGISCAPDGNLYVCDNQYFHNKDYCSRILRVVCENGQPTDKVEVVIEGLKLANGMAWYEDKLFFTDSYFDIDLDGSTGFIGSGGVFMFTLDEMKNAGSEGNAPITIKAGPDDRHCVAYQKVIKLGRGDNTGPDGICVDKDGNVWFGMFGNGFLYCLRPDADGEYKQENVENVFDALTQPGIQRGQYQGLKLECCDGICYNEKVNRIFINDSVNNAIWMFKPCSKGEKVRPTVLWKNGETDGSDGLLDQPCEAVVFDGKLVIVNFDWPFPGMVNTKVDLPGTMSSIDFAEIEKFVQREELFQSRLGNGMRQQRDRNVNGQGTRPQRRQGRNN